MEKSDSTKRRPGLGAGIRWMAMGTALCAALLAGAAGDAHAQLNFGDGKHGVFPPEPEDGMPSSFAYMVWNLRTGTVRYCNSYSVGTGVDACDGATQVAIAQIPNIPEGGLTSGVYEFTDFTFGLPTNQTRVISVVGTSPNTPLSILSTGNITFERTSGQGYFYVLGGNGQNARSSAPSLAVVGGLGGPGGFNGGASGNGGATPGHGNAGLGPAGATGGRTDAEAVAELHGASAQAAAINPSLTPLAGGSGGGGAAGVQVGHPLNCGNSGIGFAGGGGGGGGGCTPARGSGHRDPGR